MKSDSYCLDTHSLVWYFLKKKTLSLKAEEKIREVFTGKSIGVVSTLVLLEAYYIGLKDKSFNYPKFLEVVKNSNINVVPFNKRVLAKSLILPPGIDIHDRIILATAVITNSLLITKDEKLRLMHPLETVW